MHELCYPKQREKLVRGGGSGVKEIIQVGTRGCTYVRTSHA